MEPPMMRRSERAVGSLDECIDILCRADIGHLGVVDAGEPYVVPISYGVVRRGEGVTVYVHGAGDGRKVRAIATDARVCFEVAIWHGLSGLGGAVSDLTQLYESVIGFGRARVVTDPAEQVAGLRAIIAHYAPERADETPDPVPDAVTVLALDLTTLTGKRH